MFKKIINLTIATTVALAPITANAQEYRFRYVKDVMGKAPVKPEPEIGVGNDIQAYFVSVTDIPFSKEIPVATRDVRLWEIKEGNLPVGISVDLSKGLISGTSSIPQKTEILLLGYDIAGNQIARAKIFFTSSKPQGQELLFSYYGHTGQYFYQNLPTLQNIEISEWKLLDTGAPTPAGMSTEFGAFQGSPTAAGEYDLIFQGYDYFGRAVAYAHGPFLVQDGPTIEPIVGQTVDKSAGKTFNVRPTVKHSIGTITYRLVPANERPDGLDFNSSTGRISGVYDEFETSAEFQIEARDSADGTTGLSNSFTMGTLPARINIPYLQAYGLTATLGKPYSRTLQANLNDINVKFAIVGGRLPSGITMSEDGVITGTPDVLETQMVTLRISGDGATDRDIPFEFRVNAVNLSVAQTTLHTRINTPFETLPLEVKTGLVDPMTYDSIPTVPEITFNPQKLTFSSDGIATAKSYNQIVNVTNGAGDTYARSQYIRVWPELKLTYENNTNIVRDEPGTVSPIDVDYDAIRGSYSYKLEQGTLPSWLQFRHGRFTSSLKDLSDVTGQPAGPFVVSITDEFGVPAFSNPFTITAVDRKPITLSEGTLTFQYNAYDWVRPVKARDTIGARTYTLISGASQFNAYNMRFSPDGYFYGRITAPVGTEFPNLIVRVEDADGPAYAKEYGPFTMKVVEERPPVSLDGSFNRNFTWTEGKQFTGFTMPLFAGYNGLLTYELGPEAPDGLAFTNGELTGSLSDPTEPGKPIEFSYTIKDTYGRTAEGTVKLTILPTMTISAPASTTLNRGKLSSIPTTVSNGIGPYTYTLSPNSTLPAGMELNSATGVIEGTPSVEGTFEALVFVTDKTGNKNNTGTISIFVDKPLPFSISYNETKFTIGVDSTVKPTIDGAGTTTTWQHVSGKLPAGIDFIKEGDFGGSFAGTASEMGIFPDIHVIATNTDTQVSVPTTLTITVLPDEALTIESQSLKQRVTTTSQAIKLPVKNSIGTPTFTFAGDVNPYPGLIILTANGILTYSFDVPDTYSGIAIKVTDEAGQEASGTFSLEVVDTPTIQVESTTLREHETISTSLDTTNIIGTATYTLADDSSALPEGVSIDQINGKLIGTPTTASSVDGIRIKVTDNHDGQSETSEPFSITVQERAALTAPPEIAINAKQFSEISGKINYFQNVGDVTFSITPKLPDDLLFDELTGAFSGTFDDTYSGTFKVTITDSVGGLRGTTETDLIINVSPRDQLTLKTPTAGTPTLKQHQTIGAGTELFTIEGDLADVELTVTPTLPESITLSSTGLISGTPDVALNKQSFTVVATDKLGGSRGTFTYNFDLTIEPRDPLKLSGPESFAFNQHFPSYFNLTQTDAINGFEYSEVTPLPDGITLDSKTGKVEGTPKVKLPSTTYTFRVTDGIGDTNDADVRLSVGDRLLPVITSITTQPALFDHDFTKTLEKSNVLGEATWTHISGTLPPGISFNASSGSFTGKPSQLGTFPNILIGMSDTYEGVTTNAINVLFTIRVEQDGSPIQLTPASGVTRVNQSFILPALTAANTIGDTTWLATGLSGTGLSFDTKTATISGTPRAVGEVRAVVTVSDITGRSATETIIITVNPAISLQVTNESELVFNYTPAAVKYVQPVATNLHSTAVWSISGSENLPEGLLFNTATGKFEGTPLEIGAFGPITITVADNLPGTTTSAPIWFTVFMNNDPISLTLGDYIGKVGFPISTTLPVISNNLGPATFFSHDLTGKPITVNPLTGVVSGTYSNPTDYTFNVSVTDTTKRITSKPLRLQILPRMNVYAAAYTIVPAQEKMKPLKVNRLNALGAATWDPIDPSTLPEGITFNTDLGQFEGEARLLGDYGPYTVTSRDSIGDVGTSNDIYFKVQAGSSYLNLLAGPLPDAEKRTSYSYNMRDFIDPKTVGIDVSEIRWSLAGTTPPGLSISNTTGMLSGTPGLSGTFTFEVIGSVSGKERTRRAYTLNVTLPEISISLNSADLPVANVALAGKDYAVNYDFSTLVNYEGFPLDAVSYYVEPADVGEGFPAGLTINKQGKLSGTAEGLVGEYAFRLTATYKNATDEHIWHTQNYTIKVEDSLHFAFKPIEVQKLPVGERRMAYSFDLRELIEDNIKGITKDELTWNLRYTNDGGTSGILYYINNYTNNNLLEGTSSISTSRIIEVRATYADRTISQAYTLEVVLPTLSMTLVDNENAFPDLQLRQEATRVFDARRTLVKDLQNIPLENVTLSASDDVSLQGNEIAGLPPGMSIGSGTTGINSGFYTGSPTTPGTYRFKLTASFKNGSGVNLEEFSTSQEYVVKINGLGLKFDQITVGNAHACGIATNEKTYCWGLQSYGRLGNGELGAASSISYTPVEVSELPTGIKKISSGYGTTCALTTTGDVWCWGPNANGESGIGATGTIPTPAKISTFGNQIKDISTQNQAACVVTSTGTVKCVGVGNHYRLGNGTTSGSLTPVDVIDVESAVAVTVGNAHACALISNGTVKCWGNNSYGQAGDTKIGRYIQSPTTIANLTNVKTIQAGSNATCALTNDDDVYCWGYGGSGNLGSGNTGNILSPNKIDPAYTDSTTALSFSASHGCIINASGSLKCWGDNYYSQLGANPGINSTHPVEVPFLPRIQNVWTGANGTCVIDETQDAYCWGTSPLPGMGQASSSNIANPRMKVGG